jgi:hypothetical protein
VKVKIRQESSLRINIRERLKSRTKVLPILPSMLAKVKFGLARPQGQNQKLST